MTPPDLTQRQRLDLAEGKRLLSEVDRAHGTAWDSRPGENPAWKSYDGAVGAFNGWVKRHGVALLSAAEEAEKLRADNAELDARNHASEGDWNIIGESLIRRGVEYRMAQRVQIVHGIIRNEAKLREALQLAAVSLDLIADGFSGDVDEPRRIIHAALTQPEPTPGAS